MAAYHLTDTALLRIDDIYDYTFETWGEAQADKYVGGLFECFECIASRNIPWRPIPAIYEVDGFMPATKNTLCTGWNSQTAIPVLSQFFISA